MEDEIVSTNQNEIQEVKNIKPKIETCVNSKDSINWMLYQIFLKGVKIKINKKRNMKNV